MENIVGRGEKKQPWSEEAVQIFALGWIIAVVASVLVASYMLIQRGWLSLTGPS